MAPDDPCASSDFREYTALLLRNLAMLRGNKGRLVATAGVLRFLLSALDGTNPRNSLRVTAAASAALWAIVFHCERAKPALRALGAAEPGGAIATALERLADASVEHHRERSRGGAAGFGGTALFGAVVPAESLPSAERATHHLVKLQQLLTASSTT